jgi:Carbon starvation protein CstA
VKQYAAKWEEAMQNPAHALVHPNRTLSYLIWTAVALLGAFAFAGIALNRGEPISAAWLVTAAICVYLIAYRFYSKFIADKPAAR